VTVKNSYGSFPTEFVSEVKNDNQPSLANSFSDPKGEVFYLKGSSKKRADKFFHLNSHEITTDGRAVFIR
jgi:hypothetical protein